MASSQHIFLYDACALGRLHLFLIMTHCHSIGTVVIKDVYKHGTVGASPAARVHLLSRGIVCVFLFHFSLRVLDNLFEG